MNFKFFTLLLFINIYSNCQAATAPRQQTMHALPSNINENVSLLQITGRELIDRGNIVQIAAATTLSLASCAPSHCTFCLIGSCCCVAGSFCHIAGRHKIRRAEWIKKAYGYAADPELYAPYYANPAKNCPEACLKECLMELRTTNKFISQILKK